MKLKGLACCMWVLCASRFCGFVQALLLFLNAVLPPSSLTVRSEDDKRGRRKAQETKLEPFPCEPWWEQTCTVFIMRIELFLSTMSSWIIMFVRDVNVPNVSLSLSLSLSPKPTIEEIKQWAQSFDKLMKNPAGRNKFREFLRTEYSEDNMLFWLACEDLKKEINKSAIEEKTRLIYEDYVSILSPKEVHA